MHTCIFMQSNITKTRFHTCFVVHCNTISFYPFVHSYEKLYLKPFYHRLLGGFTHLGSCRSKFFEYSNKERLCLCGDCIYTNFVYFLVLNIIIFPYGIVIPMKYTLRYASVVSTFQMCISSILHTHHAQCRLMHACFLFLYYVHFSFASYYFLFLFQTGLERGSSSVPGL